MPMTRERKEALVEDLHKIASESSTLMLADYRGLDVSTMTDMRRRAREQHIGLKVVPNRLAKRALQDTPHDCLQERLTGPNLLASTEQDAGSLARFIRDFIKEHETLEVRAISVDGHLLAGNELRSVANMPSREQALSMLVGTVSAPVAKLVRTLAAVPQKLVMTLDAYAKADIKETGKGG